MDVQLPKLSLDPRNDEQLLAQQLNRTVAASGGMLSDISPGSPLFALASGQVFSIAELLYYHNLLPEAIALEVIRLCGVSRLPGTYARGEVTVLLQSPLSSQFLIPANTFLSYGNSGYYTTLPLVIPAGAIEGKTPIVAAQVGTAYNLPAMGLTVTSTGFNYAQSIYNSSPISGGSDLEPLDQTIARAQFELRSRDVLVSVADYEMKAVQLLGRSGLAKAIPRLSANKIDYETGQVHVFVCDANGQPFGTAVTQSLQADLQARSFAASRTWVSSVAMEPTGIETVVNVQQISEPVASAINTAVKAYIHPSSLGIGGDIRIKKLEYAIQSVSGVNECISTLIDGTPLNKAMPNPYSVTDLKTVAITLVDSNRNSQLYMYGLGVGDAL